MSFSLSDEGIYTCIIADENGTQRTLYVGIYRYGFNGEYKDFMYEPWLVSPG